MSIVAYFGSNKIQLLPNQFTELYYFKFKILISIFIISNPSDFNNYRLKHSITSFVANYRTKFFIVFYK